MSQRFEEILDLMDWALQSWDDCRAQFNLTDEMVEEGNEIIRLAREAATKERKGK